MPSVDQEQARDLERIRYVAANYDHLQGLRKVPLGIFLLAMLSAAAFYLLWTAANGPVTGLYMAGMLVLIFVLFLAGIVLPHYISVYYERRYGTVQRSYRTSAGRKLLYVMMVLAIYPGGSLPLLLMGLAVLTAYWSERRFQTHYVALGMLCISVALVHQACSVVWLVTDYWEWVLYGLPRAFNISAVVLYLIGGGILDHLLLIRTVQTAPEEDDAGAV